MPPTLGGMIDQNQTCPLWIPECSDGGGTPELEGNSGANRGASEVGYRESLGVARHDKFRQRIEEVA